MEARSREIQRSVAVAVGTVILLSVTDPWRRHHGLVLTPDALGWTTVWVCAIGLVAGIAAHEAGHALAARLLGFRVFTVVVGTGPTLLAFDVGSTSWIVRLLPLGGKTSLATERQRAYGLRAIVTLATGPAATAVCAVACARWLPTSGQLGGARTLLVGFHLMALLTNIVPTEGTVDGEQIRTDGGQILDTLRDGPRRFAQQKEAFARAGAAARWARADLHGALDALGSESPLAERAGHDVAAEAAILIESGDPRRAYDLATRRLALDPGDLDPDTHAHLANSAAYAALCLDDPALLDQIDALSSCAVGHLPDDVAVLDTRGWALVEMGEVRAGRAILQRVVEHVRGDGSTAVRAHILCAAIAGRDLVTARALAAQLAGRPTSEASVALARRRYAATMASLAPEERAELAALGRRPRSGPSLASDRQIHEIP